MLTREFFNAENKGSLPFKKISNIIGITPFDQKLNLLSNKTVDTR